LLGAGDSPGQIAEGNLDNNSGILRVGSCRTRRLVSAPAFLVLGELGGEKDRGGEMPLSLRSRPHNA
jgi:hypothetical protein